MKFSFSTLACPDWDFAAIAARAKEFGYAGVEIRGFLGEPAKTAADIFKDSPASVRQIFKDAGVEIACLASNISMTRDNRKNAAAADNLRKFIDTAAELGCPFVKVQDGLLQPGQSLPASGMTVGRWLQPMGEYAAQQNVTLVVENAITFRRAGELWTVLEGADHPAILAAWNVFHAALAKETPGISVPTLNSRIACVTLKDARFSPQGFTWCKLGEGEIQAPKLLMRLKGIGYKGFITFEWDKATVPTLAAPEEVLPEAIARLKDWTKPQVEPKPPKKEVPKKEVARKEPAPATAAPATPAPAAT